MANWKERFTWKSKVFVEREIDGRSFRFYSNRIALLEELAEVSKPVGLAIASLLDKDETRSVTTENFKEKVKKNLKTNEETADSTIDRTIVAAPTPEISKHRRQEREQAVNSILGAIASKPNRVLLGKLLMDSLRDDFEYAKARDAKDVEVFLYGDGEGYEGLSLPMLVHLCQGWLAANGQVFGSLGEKVTALMRSKLAELQTPPTPEVSPVDGASSTIPSSEPSDSASLSSSSSPST